MSLRSTEPETLGSVLDPKKEGVIPVRQTRYHIYRVQSDPVSFNLKKVLFGYDTIESPNKKPDQVGMVFTESCSVTTLPKLKKVPNVHTATNFLCPEDYLPIIRGKDMDSRYRLVPSKKLRNRVIK